MARAAPDAVMCSSISVFAGDAHIAMTAGSRVVFSSTGFGNIYCLSYVFVSREVKREIQ